MAKEKVVLVNDLSPGDVLIMTAAIRSLHKAYPGQYITDIRSPCNEIFQNSPYITPLAAKDKVEEAKAIETLKKDEHHPPIIVKDINGDDVKYIIAHYPEIHRSGMTGLPFVDGHRMFLEKQLDIAIPRSGMNPDIFLSPQEIAEPPMVKGRFWIVNAGIKDDYTLKYYAHYQEVVDLLKGEVQFVQVGHSGHKHPPLKGVIDLRGKTTLRQLFKLSNEADGAVCCVTMQMVIMAAFQKPCVVIAGAREGVRWQLNPEHQFLYRNGVMKCATRDGCWKSKREDCVFKAENGEPMCLELISPEEVVRAVRLYYLGGRLNSNIEVPVPGLPQIVITSKGDVYPMKEKTKKISAPVDADMNILDLSPESFFGGKEQQATATAAIINILRILKKNNPQDQYLEAYYWHYNKRGEKFTDLYHFLWWLGANVNPARILEIGSRTGVSIAQLLSACMFYDKIERIVLCDNFSELGSPEIIKANLATLNIPTDKIEFLVGDSLVEIPKLIEKVEKFSAILIDACHDKPYAAKDLDNASQLIEKGGYIYMDDISSDGCSLDDVWQDFKKKHQGEFLFSESYNGKGLGLAKKIH